MERYILLFSALFLAAQATIATDAAPIVLERIAITKGVCAVPHCDGGGLALAIASNTEFTVLALDDDSANVDAARARADDAGVLGRSLWVCEGGASNLLCADNFIDVVVVADASDDMLHALPPEEIARVLTPFRGRALVGEFSRTGSLTEAGLSNWLSGFAGLDVSTAISNDGVGTWALIRKNELPGSDWWTHRVRAPDNNQVGNDTALQWPALTQYAALPYFGVFSLGGATAGGRHYEMLDWYYKHPAVRRQIAVLRCRSLYNGQVLWEQPVASNMDSWTQTLIAESNAVYVAHEEQPGVRVYDPETGVLLKTVVFTNVVGRPRWIAIESNVLVALLGPVTEPKTPLPFLGHGITHWLVPTYRARALFGDTLAAWDLAGGTQLWAESEPLTDDVASIDPTLVAMKNGRVIYYVEQQRLVCRDLRTGALAWENTETNWMGWMQRPDGAGMEFGTHNLYVPRLFCSERVAFLCTPGAEHEAAFFALDDGRYLWHYHITRVNGMRGFFHDGLYYGDARYDEMTGSTVAGRVPLGTGCGLKTVNAGDIIAQTYGAQGNLDGGTEFKTSFPLKSACNAGTWVAGGIMLGNAGFCHCHFFARGVFGFASGAHLTNRIAPPAPAQRLEVRASLAGPLAPLDERDWPTYRADNQRTASSPAGVPLGAELLWHWQPQHPFRAAGAPQGYDTAREDKPTPPVVGGGLVVRAGTDGIVRAFEAATGTPRWEFVCNGPVYAAPTLWNGRVFVGAGDGVVYCLEGANGALLWRFQGAPYERRILVYGYLQSTWPCVTGVLVAERDGRGTNALACAAFGLHGEDGSEVVALDAVTGELRWSWRQPAGATGVFRSNNRPLVPRPLSPSGSMALAGQNLWLRTWWSATDSAPAVFSLHTGTRQDATPSGYHPPSGSWAPGVKFCTQGRDVAIMRDAVAIEGGPLLYSSQEERSRGIKIGTLQVFEHLGANGEWDYGRSRGLLVERSRIMPAFDDELIALCPGAEGVYTPDLHGTEGVAAWPVDDVLARMDAVPMYAPTNSSYFALEGGTARWHHANWQVNALALAANAVIVARGMIGEKWPSDRHAYMFTNWAIAALERETGTTLWEVPIPSEPVFGGVAVDRNGCVIASLRDGGVCAVGVVPEPGGSAAAAVTAMAVVGRRAPRRR